jgi:hypothetical protein
MFNAPKRSATIHHRDTEQHRRLVADTYRGDGWHVPVLLEEMQTTDDLYFDSVSRVHIASWARGEWCS